MQHVVTVVTGRNAMTLKTPRNLQHIAIDGMPYYASADVARSLGVSRQTLWRWRTEGKVPPGQRFRNGRILFSEEDVSLIHEYATRLVPAIPESVISRGNRND